MTAAAPQTIAWLTDQMAGAGTIRARRMFGEWGLYCDGTFFGMVCDGDLFLKPVPGVAAEGAAMAPPYPGAKPHLRLPPEAWEDAEALASLVRRTVAGLPRRA